MIVKNTADMNKFITAFRASVLIAAAAVSCSKDDALPPDWNYPIPQTELKVQTQLGAFYSNKTDQNWASPQGYTPTLNIVYDEESDTSSTVVYTSTQDGILTQQCRWADQAGIDFFVMPWNNGSGDRGLLSAFEFYRTDDMRVRVAINYSFSHLKLSNLAGEGADFEAVVAEFKSLYAELFSKEYYYRMPDGRPLLILPGNVSSAYDYSLFIPAFREAMRDYTAELQAENPEVAANVLDFYIIGENTTNWVAPQINEEAARHLDGNYVKKWYPTTYYERWYCFYPFTDMAWQNWRDYAAGWGNDFVPCIYPEYYTEAKGARSIERSVQNYTDFCNVAKRNMGAQHIVLIDSWNDFAFDTALEPTEEYGTTYLDITRNQLKKR